MTKYKSEIPKDPPKMVLGYEDSMNEDRLPFKLKILEMINKKSKKACTDEKCKFHSNKLALHRAKTQIITKKDQEEA